MLSTIQEEYKTEIAGIMEGYEKNKVRRGGLIGTVVSTKCSKSVVVKVDHDRLIPKYGKTMSVTKRIMAHDENEIGKLGDLVRIVPCRPMSRKKRHTLMDIVRRPDSVTVSDGTVFTTAGRMGRK